MLTDTERLEVDIKDLKNAYDDIVKAMNNISEVKGLDDEYKLLEIIADTIDNKRISLEVDLENLKENDEEDMWGDDSELESEYWSMQFFPHELR